MIVRRYITTASVVASMAIGLAGTAAASDASINTTGPDSYNSVVSHTSNVSVTNNESYVQVTNENYQNAKTGDVSANKNTSVEGGLTSGDATNTNGTVNTVTVSNESTVTPDNGGSGGTTPDNGGTTGGSGGEVLGASTAPGMGGGAAVLPEVGASVPVDVSALRAAWHPATTAPAATLAKGSSVFTAAMLVTATLLSLLGALGSAVYARRKERV